MEELQMEILIERGREAETFTASFMDPNHLTIEDKLKFENLFELTSANTPQTSEPVY
jgi:hypothetical protein